MKRSIQKRRGVQGVIIFPAIDILKGNCVRLIQGDYNQETIYSHSPVDMARIWEEKGAEYIHVVDLDGAKSGESPNMALIQEIAKTVKVPIQVGGGIRSVEVIEQYVSSGVSRVIIGTAAIEDPYFLQAAVESFGAKIAVSIDARNGYVATDGWTETSEVKATDLVKQLEEIGVQTIVYTDIAKDGMLSGPNFEELETINALTSMEVIASGGVSTLDDIEKLKKMKMYGAIVGKALYDGNLTFEAIVEAQK